jgi:hypothetical protein
MPSKPSRRRSLIALDDQLDAVFPTRIEEWIGAADLLGMSSRHSRHQQSAITSVGQFEKRVRGFDTRVVQKLHGHRNINSTPRYARRSDPSLRNDANRHLPLKASLPAVTIARRHEADAETPVFASANVNAFGAISIQASMSRSST